MKKSQRILPIAIKIILPVTLSALLAVLIIYLVNPPEQKIQGDINGDGIVSQSEVEFILNTAAAKISDTDAQEIILADVNKDGIVSAADAREAAKYMNFSDRKSVV